MSLGMSCKIAAVIVTSFIICSCSPQQKPLEINKVSTESLLISSNKLPREWTKEDIRTRPRNTDVENSHITFRYLGNLDVVAVHEVANFENISDAEEYYRKELDIRYVDLIDDKLSSSIKTSTTASNLSTVCGYVAASNMRLCVTVGLYKNYVSTFSSYIWEDAMTVSDYSNILNSVDTTVRDAIN